jgi:DNA-binding GntR family transcriptional regulator
MSPLKNLKTPPSLKEMAFEAIKDAILSNKLEPGRIYNEQGLAKQLGISKTPVREALLDLSARGFVRFLPRKGVMINVLTEEDIHDLYEFRNALETAIVRHITPLLTLNQMEEIERIHRKESEAIGRDDRRGYLRIDREFHLYLASLSRNRYMVTALENIRDLVDWMGSKALLRKERMMEVQDEHALIIERLRERDTEGAASMMERHIQITKENVLRNYQAPLGELSRHGSMR